MLDCFIKSHSEEWIELKKSLKEINSHSWNASEFLIEISSFNFIERIQIFVRFFICYKRDVLILGSTKQREDLGKLIVLCHRKTIDVLSVFVGWGEREA